MSQDFHLAKRNTLLLRGGVKLSVGGLLDHRFSGDNILWCNMTIVILFFFLRIGQDLLNQHHILNVFSSYCLSLSLLPTLFCKYALSHLWS